jgi:hypothetical protein
MGSTRPAIQASERPKLLINVIAISLFAVTIGNTFVIPSCHDKEQPQKLKPAQPGYNQQKGKTTQAQTNHSARDRRNDSIDRGTG